MPDNFRDEEWATILRIARAALDVPSPARPDFVQRHTSDPRIAQEALKLADELEDPEPDEPGRLSTTVGRFQLLDYLGSGAFGEVYSARDPDLLRVVAIKVLKPDAYALREQEQRFIREARAVSALNHPNIVTVHEIVRTEANLAIVMELIAGETLRKRLSGQMTIPEVVDIGRQVADGLAAAHAAGFTHRDIKPENIMVLPDKRVKILDFGLAKSPVLGDGSTASLRSGLAGTPQYMSPEHFRNEQMSTKSDIYALGLVLYEAATGSHPFPAASPLEVLHSIAVKEPEPPSRSNPAIPLRLENLILNMMSKNPSLRPSAAEVRDELKALEPRLPLPENSPGGLETWPDLRKLDSRIGRRRPYASGAFWLWTTLGVAIAAALFVFYNGMRPPASAPRIFPLSGNAGLETSPAFSPDSKQVAYSWDGNRRNFDIYVKAIEGGNPHRLTDNAGQDLDPAWSPDGKQIAFIRVLPQKSEVVIMPSTGGVEHVLEGSSPGIRWRPEGPDDSEAAVPAWSSDGTYLITPRSQDPAGLQKFYLNGQHEYLTHTPSGVYDSGASISPSGRFVGFRRVWGASSSDLYVVSSKGGNPVRLTTFGRDVQGIAWLDENNILFSCNQAGSYRLWQVRRRGGEIHPFPAEGSQPRRPALSRDGRWLAFVEPSMNAAIWRAEVPGSPEKPFQPDPFISSAGKDYSPDYSSDGKRVVFVSDRSGVTQLWTADSDGTAVSPLIEFNGSSVGSPHWSPDNRKIVFDGVVKGQSAIWLVNDDGSYLHRLDDNKAREYMPTWSRDGHWIYYTAMKGDGDRLFKQNPDTGEVLELANQPFTDAREDESGRRFYAQGRDGKLWSFPVAGGSPIPLNQLDSHAPRYWTLAGNTIYYVTDQPRSHVLASFDLASSRSRKLAIIPNELMVGTPGLTLDPTHRYLLFVQRDQRRSSIILQER